MAFNWIDHVHMLLRKLRFWVLNFVIDYCLTRTWQRVTTSDIDTEIFCHILNFLLVRFHKEGQTTSCKVEKSMNVLPPCYDAFVVRILGTFIIDELVLFSIYRIMLLIYCLKSLIVFLTGAWRVFLGLLTLGRVETVWIGGARKNSVATMPGESLMDIELSDSYIHCEYFSIVRREVTCLLTSFYRKKSRIFRLSRI